MPGSVRGMRIGLGCGVAICGVWLAVGVPFGVLFAVLSQNSVSSAIWGRKDMLSSRKDPCCIVCVMSLTHLPCEKCAGPDTVVSCLIIILLLRMPASFIHSSAQ